MSLSGKNILLIDDDPSFRGLIKKILEAQGIETKEADSLAVAEQLLVSYSPDAIILDLNLGKEMGHRFLEDRRNNPALKKIPVLVCSADAQSEIVRRSILLGADDFLIKPVKQTWLIQRLHKHLINQKLLSKRFAGESAPKANIEFDAQMIGIGEGHCIFRSQAKFQKDAKIDIACNFFTENSILVKFVRVDGDSRAGMQGLYDTPCTLLGITEKEASTIRKLKAAWRSR